MAETGKNRKERRNREEAVNTQFAVLISGMGVDADAETIHGGGAHRPDVMFQLRGLRVVIEAKFADVANAKGAVIKDARKRVHAGIAHIAAAVVYPETVRKSPTKNLLNALEIARLQYRIITESFEQDKWSEGTPSSLMEALRRAQESLTEDNIVERTAEQLNVRLSAIAALWMGQPGTCDRLSKILGNSPPKKEKLADANDRRESSAKIAALVLANALIFQEQLAGARPEIKPLATMEKATAIMNALSDHWSFIRHKINYVPIFQLGMDVLETLPSNEETANAVRSLLKEIKAICENKAALRHDLMGRIYHWLLPDAKYLGTFYTSVSAATLLMKLAFSEKWAENFGERKTLSSFRIGDIACGTGTLLMAAAQATADEYIKFRSENRRSLKQSDLSQMHKNLMEDMLHGYDVLPSAVHLTASTLAMLSPEVKFNKMNLWIMPYGVYRKSNRLGSLDFISEGRVQTQLTLDGSHAEILRADMNQSTHAVAVQIPDLDLCVMNPPYVRNVGGNLIFGSLPERERGLLKEELKKRVRNNQLSANIVAGLGSVFMALADKNLKEGGRLAFVLPLGLATGEAWGINRQLIADGYHLEKVVSSHDAERFNFSENTNLSEILFIARKLKKGEKPGRTTYVNLWKNPRSIHEALQTANAIRNIGHVSKIEDSGATHVSGGNGKIAEMVSMPASSAEENWTAALFAQTELLRIFWRLQQGVLSVPGQTETPDIKICRLDEFGDLGPDRAGVHGSFRKSEGGWTPYPSFWGNSGDVQSIAQIPNRFLELREGRNKQAQKLWSRAGKILLIETLRANTQNLIAARCNEEVLSNVWWPFDTGSMNEDVEKILALWLNSTFGVLLYFGRRVSTEGAFVHMKQPAWAAMPVVDVRQLSKQQTKSLSREYDNTAHLSLSPLSQLNDDPVRIQIDEALCRTLKLPSAKAVRELLAREPGLTGIAGR